MQKKIIASLLVSPLAFNAMADINMPDAIDYASWKVSGLSGDTKIIDVDGRTITSTIGTGVVSQTLKGLVPGDYLISFTQADNAKISVKGDGVNGNAVEVAGPTELRFKVTKNCDVVLSVEAKNASEIFSLAGGVLKIEFDFSQENQRLSGRLTAATTLINALDPKNQFDEARKIRTDIADQTKVAEEVSRKIDEIQEEKSDTEKLGVYQKYALHMTGNTTIDEDIDALETEFSQIDERINTENTRYGNQKKNETSYGTYIDEVTSLRNALAAALKVINDAEASAELKESYKSKGSLIESSIDKYESEIEVAFKSDGKILDNKVVEFPSQTEAINNQITGLSTDFTNAVNNANAVVALTDKQKDLTKAYQKAQTTIIGLKTAEDAPEDAFSANQTEWMNEVLTAKTDADSKIDEILEDKDNVASRLSEGKTAITDAINAIGEVETKAKKHAEGQNDAWTVAQMAITERKNGDYAEAKNNYAEAQEVLKDMPEEFKTSYESLVGEIDDLIKAIEDVVKSAYGTNLAEGTYTEKLSELDGKISALSTLIAQSNIMDAVEKANQLKADKKELYAVLTDLEDAVTESISNRFSTVIGLFNSAIEAYTLESDKQKIKDDITAAKAAAERLAGAFNDVESSLNKLNTAINALNNAIGTNSTEELRSSCVDFNQRLTNAKDPTKFTDQECYDELISLLSEINTYGWQDKVNYAFNNYWVNSVDTDLAVAKTKLANIKAHSTASLVSTLTTGFDSTMAEIDVAKEAATTQNVVTFEYESDTKLTDATIKNIADKGTECNAVKKSISDLIGSLDKLIANQEAYDELDTLLDGANSAITAATEANRETLEPAKTHFTDKIGELSTEAQDIKKAMYESIADLEEGALSTTKSTVEARIKKLTDDANNIPTFVKENNAAHERLLSESLATRNHINECIKVISEKADDVVSQTWINNLKALLSSTKDGEGIIPIDRKVSDAFGNGECSKQENILLQEYEAIKAKATSEKEKFDSDNGYSQAVKDYNENLMIAGEWESTKGALNSAYIDAISTYNKYNKISNPGYRSHLENVFTSNADIYNCGKDNRDYINTVESEVATADSPLAEDYFTETVAAKVAELLSNIQNKLDKLNASFNKAGKEYYEILQPNASNVLETAKAEVEEAGIEGSVLQDYQKSYDEATELYENTASGEIGLKMDGIAPLLDKVVALNLQNAAATAWKDKYDEIHEQLSGLNDKYGSYDYDEVHSISEALDNAVTLNNTVSSIQSGLLGVLAEKFSELDSYLTAAQAAAAAIDTKVANKQLHETTLNGYRQDIETYSTNLEELKKFINALGYVKPLASPVASIKSSIEALNTLIENSGAEGKILDPAVVTDITNKKSGIESDINTAYGDASIAEISYLTDLLDNTKVAFNDAYEVFDKFSDKSTLTQGDVDEYTLKIDTAINDLANLVGLNSSEGSDVFKVKALGLEKDLSSYITFLENSHKADFENGTKLDAVNAALDDALNELSEELSKAKSELDGYYDSVKEKYNYSDIDALVKAIKDDRTSAGDGVIAQKYNFLTRIKQATETLNQKKTEIEEAQHKADIAAKNNAAADGYQATLNTLSSRLLSLEKWLEGKDLGIDLTNVRELITAANGTIEEVRNATELVTEAPFNELGITNAINRVTLESKLAYASKKKLEAKEAYDKANALSKANLLPEILKDVNEKLGTGFAEYTSLASGLENFTYDYAAGFEEANKALDEGVAELPQESKQKPQLSQVEAFLCP